MDLILLIEAYKGTYGSAGGGGCLSLAQISLYDSIHDRLREGHGRHRQPPLHR